MLWEHLKRHKGLVKNEAWIVMGDFNVSLDLCDSSRGSSSVSRGMMNFRECVDDLEVEDINQSGIKFTWIQKPMFDVGSRGLLKKLDRVLGNLGFLDEFYAAHASFLPYGLSDHNPVVLIIPNLSSFKSSPFKFNNHLADNPGFINIVSKAWCNSYKGCLVFSVISKLKDAKKGLRKLNMDHGNVF